MQGYLHQYLIYLQFEDKLDKIKQFVVLNRNSKLQLKCKLTVILFLLLKVI